MTFDQADIRHEAEAFAAFVAGAIRGYGLEAGKLVFLGYSNGANLGRGDVAASRPDQPRDPVARHRGSGSAAECRSGGTRTLLVSGAADPFAAATPALVASLRQSGADLDERIIQAGHELADADGEIARDWLGSAG